MLQKSRQLQSKEIQIPDLYLFQIPIVFNFFFPLQISFINFSILDHIRLRQAIGQFKHWWHFLGYLPSIILLYIVARFL